MKPDAMPGWQEEENMTTDNDAMKALESMPRPEYNDDRLGDWASENYETIRAALKKSAQVDALITILRDLENHCQVKNPECQGNPAKHREEGLAIRVRVKQALQKFSATEI